ncbi:MAG: 16S rRNA (guanine(966)-N(2))-methyltransferase RsmD [Ignavibacteria bacterium]|jgi:16S rRNA (guanine966-N2)-methyltransferase
MRVITGKLKGRTIKMPKSKLVRPTTDKNKEAIFNYLNNFVDFDGITACDIYAGSGSLGIEIISRGAKEVHFIEKNYNVLNVLKENLKTLGIEDSAKVFKTDAVKFSKFESHIQYDLIIADPPFFNDDIHFVFNNIIENEFLSRHSLFIIERSIQTEKKDIEAFKINPAKRMGDSLIYVHKFGNK